MTQYKKQVRFPRQINQLRPEQFMNKVKEHGAHCLLFKQKRAAENYRRACHGVRARTLRRNDEAFNVGNDPFFVATSPWDGIAYRMEKVMAKPYEGWWKLTGVDEEPLLVMSGSPEEVDKFMEEWADQQTGESNDEEVPDQQ